MADGWCTIESDPGVFTELLSAFQVKDVQLDELYSLDDDTLKSMGKIHGLIFLFKWQKAPEGSAPPVISEDPTIYFANQTVNNACATQALIQILLNKDDIEVGPELSMLKEFTAEMPSDMRGEAISNSESVRAYASNPTGCSCCCIFSSARFRCGCVGLLWQDCLRFTEAFLTRVAYLLLAGLLAIYGAFLTEVAC